MELHRPDTPLLKLLALIAAGLAGWWTWNALATSHADPAAVERAVPTVFAFDNLEQVELGWVEERFDEALVYAPPGPLPCREGLFSPSFGEARVVEAVRQALAVNERNEAITLLTRHSRKSTDHWLAHLVLGQFLMQEGRMDFATETLDDWLSDRHEYFIGLRGKIESGTASAIEQRTFEGFLSLYFASGQVRLRQQMMDEELWYALRHAIGACSSTIRGQGRGMVDREPCTVEQWLAAPGCEAQGISSYDLYNNLLVGYLQDHNYRASDDGRRREFRRDREPSPEANPLSAILKTARDGWTPAHESRTNWWFAVSNAESLLRGNGQKAPEHALLSFHLAQLLESVRGHAPPAALPALLRQRNELIRAARRNLLSVKQAEDRTRLARGLTRLEWIAVIRDGADFDPRDGEDLLDEEQRRMGKALAKSRDLRAKPADFARRTLSQDLETLAELGGASDWFRAARRDLAVALAEVDADLAYGVLEAGDGVPVALEGRGGLGNWVHALRGSSGGPFIMAGIAALIFAAVLGLGLWLALQMRRRKELFTSFYRRETIARMEGA